MVKVKFEDLDELIDYVEENFSKTRERNPQGFKFEHKETIREREVAYLIFSHETQSDIVFCAVRIPAHDTWIGWVPTFDHYPLKELPRIISDADMENFKGDNIEGDEDGSVELIEGVDL